MATPFALALLLYYAYNGEESGRAFGAIAAAQPQDAMAYWGEALASGPDLNNAMTPGRFARGQAAIQQAVSLDAGASSRDAALIAALALRYRGSYDDFERNDVAYGDAMERLAAASDDADVRMLTAEALLERGRMQWSHGALDAPESRRALSLVQAELARDPANVMGNHLCIHIYDQAQDRTPAIPCAKALDAMTFTPAQEHLAHMPAHTWIEVGEYAKAVASSERAYALVTQYVAGAGHLHDPLQDHDIYTGYSAAMMLGNYARAKIWSDRTAAAMDLPLAAQTAIRFGRYADAYAMTAPPNMGDVAVRGYAALRLGKLDEARAAAKQLKSGEMPGYSAPLFLARLAEAEGNLREAQTWIDRAVEVESASFAAESIPLWPALEARGGLFLRTGDNAKAAAAFREALAAYPNDPRALFGLATALERLGDAAGAADANAAFARIWAGADTTPSVDDL